MGLLTSILPRAVLLAGLRRTKSSEPLADVFSGDEVVNGAPTAVAKPFSCSTSDPRISALLVATRAKDLERPGEKKMVQD